MFLLTLSGLRSVGIQSEQRELGCRDLSDVDNEGLPELDRSGTVIISRYYWVPGARQVYIDPARQPQAFSPQLSDWSWLPRNLSATYALMIDYRPSDVEWMCNAPTLSPTSTSLIRSQGAPVTICSLKGSIQSIWGRLRDFT
jgi:hypothetical protein